MKIKFIKEYVAVDPVPTSGIIHRYRVGETKEITPYTAQWLIDNGFAEKVEKKWPTYDDQHWYVDRAGDVMSNRWTCDSFDDRLKAIGNVFKTEESAQRFIDYLKAVETVRHDEGFMKPSRKINYSPCGYGVYRGFGKSIIAEVSDTTVSAGEFYFDTHEHAKASVEAHQPEWQTILNYDWSKGEEDEDEED